MKQNPATTKIYTQDRLISILEKYPEIQLSKVKERMKCGESTAFKLIKDAMKEGKVTQINKGHPNKPAYYYKVCNNATRKRA